MKRALLLLLVSLVIGSAADAQTCPVQKPIRPWTGCVKCPPINAPGDHLAGNRTMTVRLDPSMPAGLQMAAIQAFENWQNHPSNTTGISYVYTTNVGLAAEGDSVGTNVVQVRYGDAGGYQAVTDFEADWAWMIIDTQVTCVEAMTQAVAHEIGHSMGINDCPNCCPGSSVMTLHDGMNGTQMGRAEPSDCDAQTSARRFEDDTVEELLPVPSGGGAEPVDHLPQCTDYYLITWMWTQSGGFVIIDEEYLGCW